MKSNGGMTDCRKVHFSKVCDFLRCDMVDSGLQNNRENSFAAENISWRLENVAYIDLFCNRMA